MGMSNCPSLAVLGTGGKMWLVVLVPTGVEYHVQSPSGLRRETRKRGVFFFLHQPSSFIMSCQISIIASIDHDLFSTWEELFPATAKGGYCETFSRMSKRSRELQAVCT